MDELYKHNLLPVMWINELRAHSRAIEADVFDIMITTDEKENARLLKDIEERTKIFDRDLALYEQIPLAPFEKEKLREVKSNLEKYRTNAKTVLELAKQNKNVEAYQLYNSSARQFLVAFNNNLIQLAEFIGKEANDSNEINKAASKEAVMLFIAIVLLGTVLVFTIGGIIIRIINSNLKAVTTHLGILGNGDFSKDVPVESLQLRDEFGTLAKAFAAMQNSIRTLISQLSQMAEQLAASAEELTASAEQSSQAANQVAIAITDVAHGAEQQLTSIDNATTTVEQVSINIQQIVTNTTVMENTSAKTAGTAKEGMKAVETSINQMYNIEKTVNSSAIVVTKLGERSKEIGQIVDTISGIAGQTNLLALNAAIEAARAGEQGRGFAVVADEVRKLAEQSQDAAKQIAALISEIKMDTNHAVIAMTEGTKEVTKGTEVVNTAGQSFKEIATLVGALSNQGQEIATSIQKVGAGSQQIISDIKEIDDVSKNLTEQTQTVSAATEEQSASMEEIAASSQSLAKLAEDLQYAIQKFKI